MFSSLFSWRDSSIYPDDEFGEELYRLYPRRDAIPVQALVWIDMYFEDERDADLMAEDLENRGWEINRDYDDEPDEGYGRWNIDVEIPIKPSYREIKNTVEQAREKLTSRGGKFGSWLLVPAE